MSGPTRLPPRGQETVMPGRLRALALFNRLSAEQLIVIANRSQLRRFRDGDCVMSRGENEAFDYFLLDGNVGIADPDGNSRLLAAGTPAAAHPLAPLRPNPYEVRAIGPVVCAKLSREDVARLRELTERSAPSVPLAASADAAAVISRIEADLQADRLRLPSPPDIALNIRDAIARSNCDSQHIADLLAADPAIAAKILKIANSPLCRGASRAATLREAVMRIGWVAVSELVVCFSLKDIFQADAPDLRARFMTLTEAAVRVGATASVVAERVAPETREHALIAGLLSSIGALPILDCVRREASLAEQPEQVEQLLTQHAARVGGTLCRKWGLDENVALAVAHADDWTHADTGAPTLSEIVLVSRYLARLGEQLGGRPPRRGAVSEASLPRPDDIAAMRILGTPADPELGLDIIRASRARIDALLDVAA